LNKPWWIKQRYNPQLGMYYVPMGQMSVAAAKRQEKALYGSNVMLRFDTEDKYKQAVQKYKEEAGKDGE